jgi:hypothetical protein
MVRTSEQESERNRFNVVKQYRRWNSKEAEKGTQKEIFQRPNSWRTAWALSEETEVTRLKTLPKKFKGLQAHENIIQDTGFLKTILKGRQNSKPKAGIMIISQHRWGHT